MSTNTTELCQSTLDERDLHGGFALCELSAGHESVHVGHAPDSERFQWTEAEAYKMSDPLVDETNVWTHVFPPVDTIVDVKLVGGDTRRGTFALGVLTESGPVAIVLTNEASQWSDAQSRTIPWHAIIELQWKGGES